MAEQAISVLIAALALIAIGVACQAESILITDQRIGRAALEQLLADPPPAACW
jgi:hypothetical protein